MSTPVLEKEQYSFPVFEPNPMADRQYARHSSEGDTNTLRGDSRDDPAKDEIDHNHLRVTPSYATGMENFQRRDASAMSHSAQREHAHRLDDDLQMLRAERVVSNAEKSIKDTVSRSMVRSRSRTNVEPVDDFDVDTAPIHEKNKIYQPPPNPTTRVAKFFKRVHSSSFLVRYFVYITPLVLLLLIPLLLGLLKFKQTTVGGVELLWFGVWLEIVWLTLWLGRIIAKLIPWHMGVVASLFTNDEKKWRDLGKALEVPATLFFWLLAVEISFLPTMKNHHLNGDKATRQWEIIVNKIIIALFVFAVLNLIEKIIIQLIAISFHMRTYADRIEINRFQIASLVKLYIYSKEQIAMEDAEFEEDESGPASGARTPMVYVQKAQKSVRHAFNRFGDVAGKVAGDFTGKAVTSSTHPQQVILQLLANTVGSQVLARRLWRTFVQENRENVLADDLRPAFDNDEEADSAFTMFDKDLNGDISIEELEAVCVEIGRERKAITASLKDLDSVISKLDDVLMFAVAVITILVFVSIISTSAQTAITSLGSTVLALSWLFSATAQEFLQSTIFVFVKHPFDVGDRVTIYGNTGSQLKGDDYFVKEISLLYTEFKKMEGHVVQAPNTYLNTIFILNQRRSGGLAEAVPVTVKFGTTLEQIDTLRQRLLEFVTAEHREYQKNILTELTTIYESYSITLNVIFFYKSNWQNELLRLQRRNKFICALMVTMQELGMEGPRMKLAGAAPEWPLYLNRGQSPIPVSEQQHPSDSGQEIEVDTPGTTQQGDSSTFGTSQPMYRSSSQPLHPLPLNNHPSILRQRGETIAQMGKRVDFSLGISAISSSADFGDVYESRKPVKLPPVVGARPGRRSTSSSSRPGQSREPGTHANVAGPRASGDSENLSRWTSQTSLARVASLGSNRTHRNRFFPRGRSKLGWQLGASADEGTTLDDLEAGTLDIGGAGDVPMPDIPEGSGSNSRIWADGPIGGDSSGTLHVPEQTAATGGSGGNIDPRTGIVSPQAVADDRALARGVLPTDVSGHGHDASSMPPVQVQVPRRAATTGTGARDNTTRFSRLFE